MLQKLTPRDAVGARARESVTNFDCDSCGGKSIPAHSFWRGAASAAPYKSFFFIPSGLQRLRKNSLGSVLRQGTTLVVP